LCNAGYTQQSSGDEGLGPIRRTSQEGASSVPPRICSSISFVSCLIASLGSLEGVLRRLVCSCGRSFIGGLNDTSKLLRNFSRCLYQKGYGNEVQVCNRTSDYSQFKCRVIDVSCQNVRSYSCNTSFQRRNFRMIS